MHSSHKFISWRVDPPPIPAPSCPAASPTPACIPLVAPQQRAQPLRKRGLAVARVQHPVCQHALLHPAAVYRLASSGLWVVCAGQTGRALAKRYAANSLKLSCCQGGNTKTSWRPSRPCSPRQLLCGLLVQLQLLLGLPDQVGLVLALHPGALHLPRSRPKAARRQQGSGRRRNSAGGAAAAAVQRADQWQEMAWLMRNRRSGGKNPRRGRKQGWAAPSNGAAFCGRQTGKALPRRWTAQALVAPRLCPPSCQLHPRCVAHVCNVTPAWPPACTRGAQSAGQSAAAAAAPGRRHPWRQRECRLGLDAFPAACRAFDG